MKSDFLIALTQLAAERNLPREKVLEAIEAALASAYRKDSITSGQNISVKLDPGSGEVWVYVLKTVVEVVTDDQTEISLSEARKNKASAEVGETVIAESFPHNAGRIAAQTAKQVVMQRLREAERDLVFQEFEDKEGEVFSVTLQRVDPKQIVVDLGRAEAVMPLAEQVPGERYRAGQKMKVLLQNVGRSSKGPELIVSRADKLLLKRLFEMEVPEIYNGSVEIVAIAREAGSRSKVAVRAKQDGVDPVGSCVGLRGVRIQNIVNELHGEKIDVVEWSKDPASFVINALSPSQVMRVQLDSEHQFAVAVVPDRQLSLAIGKEGQNARLAARLTGWKVDIKSNIEYDAEVAERAKLKAEMVEEPEEVSAEVAQLEEELVEELVEAVAEQPDAGPEVDFVEETVTELEPVVAQVDEAEVDGIVDEVPVAEIEVEAVVEEAEAEAPSEEEDIVPEPVLEAVETEDVVPETVEDGQFEPDWAQEAEEPEPVAPGMDRAASLRDLPEDVWSVRRAGAAPKPGQIRFAEDIAGLRGGVTASRRGRRDEEPTRERRRTKTKAGKKRGPRN
jgi:N utilization substance protein A